MIQKVNYLKHINLSLVLLVIIGYLGSYGGKLCIYNKSKIQPIYIFPYSVSIFPKNDQAMLDHGIPYQNEEEFSRLMEDFLS